MASPTVDNGALTDYQVSSDTGANGVIQRMKLCYSADGDETHIPADANGLKVNIGTAGEVGLNAATLAALETIQVGSLPNVALDVATLAALETINVGNFPAVQPINDNGGSLTVDGTFWQATQPVSGPLTDTQLRASAVPVSMATQTPDVTDRDARLLGRAKLLDASGAVIDPATKGQLPAALAAGGGMKVEGVAGGVALPVSGTFFQATQPVSLATNTPDVTDRDARLLGRAKLLDSGGAVIDPATKGQLPAALVSGRLSVDASGATVPVSGTFWQATQPVSLATNTPDVTDRAAREAGRVRIWDGTDEATVLPVRTQPATTEKVLVTSELPARLSTFQAVTAEVAPAITIGVKELLNFFHPAAVTVDVYIVEIVVSILVTTASTTGGRTNIEVFKSTTVGSGGTNLAAADVGGGLGTSAVITNAAANVMQAKTGGGTLGTALIRQGVEHATQPIGAQRFEVFKASSVGNGIIMRGGSADGINVQVNRVVAHTALVDQWTASIRWIEL